jgi:hypothetical protein
MSASVRAIMLSGTACLLVLGATGGARAADATPAQAAALQTQVREAIGSLLGPAVKLADSPIKITAAGDHYDVSLPIPIPRLGGTGAPAQTIQFTGAARPGDNGTWIVENVKTTNPLRFTIDMPLPPTTPGAPAQTVPVTYMLDQQGQSGRILWDPSFKTPSTWTTSTVSTRVHSEGGPMQQTTSIGPVNAVNTLRPSGPDRVDALLDGTIQDYHMESSAQPGGTQRGGTLGTGAMQVGIKTVRVTTALNGVSREHATSLVQSLAGIIATAATAQPGHGAPPVPAELVRSLLASLQDFATDFSLAETMDGFIVNAQGQTVALDRMKLGLDARSDTGLLRAGMTLGMEGLTLPDVPLGEMAALIPTRIAIRPVMGGIAVADLVHLATLSSEKKEPTPADIGALFSHGGITGGIESMAVDVAGARFTGQGTMVATAPAPDAISGTATITAENFDVLMQKVTAMPGLAQQAVPVMLFIKGIGRNVDNKLVWDISYKNNRVLINNVDLSAMAGGAAPTTAPAPTSPPPTSGKRPAGTVRPLPSWAK